MPSKLPAPKNIAALDAPPKPLTVLGPERGAMLLPDYLPNPLLSLLARACAAAVL